eukprot:363887-Chlamydomonas_euryale.AAC.3
MRQTGAGAAATRRSSRCHRRCRRRAHRAPPAQPQPTVLTRGGAAQATSGARPRRPPRPRPTCSAAHSSPAAGSPPTASRTAPRHPLHAAPAHTRGCTPAAKRRMACAAVSPPRTARSKAPPARSPAAAPLMQPPRPAATAPYPQARPAPAAAGSRAPTPPASPHPDDDPAERQHTERWQGRAHWPGRACSPGQAPRRAWLHPRARAPLACPTAAPRAAARPPRAPPVPGQALRPPTPRWTLGAVPARPRPRRRRAAP